MGQAFSIISLVVFIFSAARIRLTEDPVKEYHDLTTVDSEVASVKAKTVERNIAQQFQNTAIPEGVTRRLRSF